MVEFIGASPTAPRSRTLQVWEAFVLRNIPVHVQRWLDNNPTMDNIRRRPLVITALRPPHPCPTQTARKLHRREPLQYLPPVPERLVPVLSLHFPDPVTVLGSIKALYSGTV
jgi:hypothetical protein